MSKKKQIKFKGRIVNSDYDFQTRTSDVGGPHQVWYPKSKADVARAILLSQGKKRLIRSGIQMVTSDIEDGTGGIVINLSKLRKVMIKGEEVFAEAAATTELISEELIKHNLVLPLSDKVYKSIVSNVLHEGTSYLMRTLGSLEDYILKIRGARPNGKSITINGSNTISCVTRCITSNAIITQVTFKAISAKGLWMLRKTCPYPGKEHFLKIITALFSDTILFEKNDLVLEAYNGLHEVPLIRVSAFGAFRKGKKRLEELMEGAINEVLNKTEIDIIDEKASGTAVLERMMESETGAAFDSTINSQRYHKVHNSGKKPADFLISYAEEVHRGISFGDKGNGKLNEEFFVSRIQVNQEDKLEITGHIFTPNPTIGYPPPARLATKSVKEKFQLSPTQTKKYIPDFKGEIYQSRDLGYNKAKEQYATSSYPEEKTKPFMVAYPHDKDDISAAIAFAKTKNKRIVSRSGGHQYAGKSSGGKDTIVLSMDAFDEWKCIDNIAEVGPAVKLTTLAKHFKNLGITVPHGECPYVAVGGHAQTGGYGHLLRSFGLLLDFIESFDIVLGDGSHRTVTRPKGNATSESDEEKLNRELFWGVLGGNAGSFGIITKYKFKAIKDDDFLNSYRFTSTRKFKESNFLKMMKKVQKWTKGVEKRTLPPNMDLMMTVTSRGRLPFPALLIELVHANLTKANASKEFSSIIKTASSGAELWERALSKKGYKNLSEISDSFVRRWPATTLDGREFKNPYKKRVNCTRKGLTTAFINEFVRIISHVVNDVPEVNLVFQMSIGGGVYQKNKNRKETSIPHRDYVFCFVFDLFYSKGHDGTAANLQNRMQTLIDNHFSKDQELRVFWGSFGDTDMSKPAVRQMYYNDEVQYTRLQTLKQEVDPDDVFHTEFTVQLPVYA